MKQKLITIAVLMLCIFFSANDSRSCERKTSLSAQSVDDSKSNVSRLTSDISRISIPILDLTTFLN